MRSEVSSEVRGHEFAEVGDSAREPSTHLEMRDLRDVRLSVSVDLGSCSMPVRQVLELKRGSVVSLDKLAGEMADIFVNGRLLARGEVVVINDLLHVRIAEILGASERTDE